MGIATAKKTYGLFVGLIVGIIILSFVFTGVYLPQGSADTVAEVDEYSVKASEFRRAFDYRISYLSQFGIRLTTKQIEDRKIKQQILDELIKSKLLLVLAKNIGVQTSEEEIAEAIQQMPQFQKNDRFSLDIYKRTLAANRQTPATFEDYFKEIIKLRRIDQIIKSPPLSKTFAEDLKQFAQDKKTATGIKLPKAILTKFVEVSNEQVDAYLEKKENVERTKALFAQRKPSLNIKPSVKARQILLKYEGKTEAKVLEQAKKLAKSLSTSNFSAKAKELSEDPLTKDQGGSMGWFERGSKIKSLEDAAFALKPGQVSAPVKTSLGFHIILVEDQKPGKEATFDEHKNKLAKELIQQSSPEALAEQVKKVVPVLSKAIASNDKKELENLRRKYQFALQHNETLTRLDGKIGQLIQLETDQVETIFSKENKEKNFKFENAAYVYLVHTQEFKDPKKKEKDEVLAKADDGAENALRNQQYALGIKLTTELQKHLFEKAKIKTYAGRL